MSEKAKGVKTKGSREDGEIAAIAIVVALSVCSFFGVCAMLLSSYRTVPAAQTMYVCIILSVIFNGVLIFRDTKLVSYHNSPKEIFQAGVVCAATSVILGVIYGAVVCFIWALTLIILNNSPDITDGIFVHAGIGVDAIKIALGVGVPGFV